MQLIRGIRVIYFEDRSLNTAEKIIVEHKRCEIWGGKKQAGERNNEKGCGGLERGMVLKSVVVAFAFYAT